MTKQEKIKKLLNDETNKTNYEAIAQHMSNQFVSVLNQSGDFDGADLFEEVMDETRSIVNWESILPILEDIYDKWYNEEEINFLYEQTTNPISKQISEKVVKIQIDVMEKMDELFANKVMEKLNDNKA